MSKETVREFSTFFFFSKTRNAYVLTYMDNYANALFYFYAQICTQLKSLQYKMFLEYAKKFRKPKYSSQSSRNLSQTIPYHKSTKHYLSKRGLYSNILPYTLRLTKRSFPHFSHHTLFINLLH
jgi:hypothetical protein